MDAKILELSAKRAKIMVAALCKLTAPRFWPLPRRPKIDFKSHSKTSTNIAPECDLEPFCGHAPIGTLGPRLMGKNLVASGFASIITILPVLRHFLNLLHVSIS